MRLGCFGIAEHYTLLLRSNSCFVHISDVIEKVVGSLFQEGFKRLSLKVAAYDVIMIIVCFLWDLN